MEDCLDSIRDQGLSSYETVLVLDHVQEEISELLQEYHDINLKVVELNDPVARGGKSEFLAGHAGVAAARNAGLEAASGEYVYFLDSDDFILLGTLPLLLKEAQEEKADFTYGRRVSTWFRRITFLGTQSQNETDAIEEQDSEGSKDLEENLKGNEEIAPDTYDELSHEKSIEMPMEISEIKALAEAYDNLFVSRKGIMNVSVLGILFRRDFLAEHGICFPEEYIYYTDFMVVLLTLRNARICRFVEEAVYIKRKHNDPIYYPALVQIKDEGRFEEFIRAYEQGKALLQKGTLLYRYAERKLIRYFTMVYAPRLRRSENDVWRGERFERIRTCMKEVSKEEIQNLRKYERRIVNSLLKGNVRRATRNISLHLAGKKVRKIWKNYRVFSYYLYFKLFLKMPMKEDWVLCESFFGKSYADSPKNIYEYMAKNYPGKYRFIWVINKSTKIPYHPVKVKRFSIRYAYYMARSKYFIFNGRQPEWMRKREGSIFLQTWHGTPLKRLVFDQEEVMAATPLYKAQVYKQSRMWDYLISANHFSTEVFRRAFRFDKEILEFGYPRNDILHDENKDILAAEIKRKLRIPPNKKTILYAPTWRDDEYYGKGEYKFALKLDLRTLKKELGPDYVILLRTHYFIADSLDTTGLEDFAVNVSKYDDISELYLISDVLITDYSSVFFDYANLKRPILFYTYDLDKYRDILRGFYLDMESEVPGPLLFTNEEVIDAIHRIEEISLEYQERYDQFYERFCSLEDGYASKRIADKIFGLSDTKEMQQ